MRASRIHGEELPLHVEEAHVRAAAEGGVEEPAAPAAERRHRPDQPPRRALRPSSLRPAASSHGHTGRSGAPQSLGDPAERALVVPLRGECSMLNSGLASTVPLSAASPSGLRRRQQPHPSGTRSAALQHKR